MQVTDQYAWDDLFAAYAQFYRVPQSPEMRATVWAWLSDPSHEVNGLVADNNGTLIGFAHYRSCARPLAATFGLFWMIYLLLKQPAVLGQRMRLLMRSR